jgi:hypothetical protein
MNLPNEDFSEVLNHFLTKVKQYDPAGYEKLIARMEFDTDSAKRLLLNAISSYSEIGKIRSKYTHTESLDRLNEFVSTEKKSRITGIKVSLSAGEREIYGRDEIDLTPRQDFSKFNESLHGLWEIIAGNEGYAHE